MPKKVAVLAVNPVHGMGLFQHLEAFYENKIPFTGYAATEKCPYAAEIKSVSRTGDYKLAGSSTSYIL